MLSNSQSVNYIKALGGGRTKHVNRGKRKCTKDIIIIVIIIIIIMALQPFVKPSLLSELPDPVHSRTPWTRDQPVARPLRTQKNTNAE
jgi:hypothetical protein